MRNIILLLIVFIFQNSYCQTVIKLTKANGVYTVPCQINGKTDVFFFDTGASNVTISLGYYTKGIKEGFLKTSDILPEIVNFKVANGSIQTGRLINIRELKIGNLKLYNIVATIVENEDSPLLLGQTALEKFGTYTVNTTNSTLSILGNSSTDIDIALKEAKKQAYSKLSKLPNGEQKTILEAQIVQTKVDILSDTKIILNLEFEVYEIKYSNNGDIDFEYDITNKSTVNYKNKPLSQIHIYIDVYTEDGKVYSTSSPLPELLSGNSANGHSSSINLRNRKPKYFRIYGVINSPLLTMLHNND